MVDLRARFGGLVKAHRVRLGLTQEALAERANISTDMVSKIEGGNSGARFGVITQLSAALGVDPDTLFSQEIFCGTHPRVVYAVASGEADLACRITHIPKSAFA